MNKKYLIKGGIIGIVIWGILALIYFISGALIDCSIEIEAGGRIVSVEDLPFPLTCTNSIQNVIGAIFVILSFPFTIAIFFRYALVSGTPPIAEVLSWISYAISFILWGILIGWIVRRRKLKKK